MAKCKYCGQPAGFFSKQHQECYLKNSHALYELEQRAKDVLAERFVLEDLRDLLEKHKHESYLSDSQVQITVVSAWEQQIEKYLDDGRLSEEEDKKLSDFMKGFNFPQAAWDINGGLTRAAKAAVLRDVMQGKMPPQLNVQGALPFNFTKDEGLIWLFQGVEYLEDKVRTHYEGRSSGVSIRMAKGVYYKVGSYKGHPVRVTNREYIAKGMLAITNKHIYFHSPQKSFRIKHDKIISMEPASDGITICRDAATAKPQCFVTNDGWFTHNLLANVQLVS